MIPYINVPPLDIGFLPPIQPFGALVVVALFVGYHLSRLRARAVGLDAEICGEGVIWTAVVGFVLGHMLEVILYKPWKLVDDPLILAKLWIGLSSFGGFVGGALGAYLYFRYKKVSILRYAEAILFGLLPGWIFGRMGCATVHDHPGKPTTFFLGVTCAEVCRLPWEPGMTRHDLGLYEMLFTIFLTIVIYAARNVRPFHGFHFGLMMFMYAPVRFLFDFLRIRDRLYFGLTPGQFYCFGMIGLGVAFWVYGRRLKAKGFFPGSPASDAAAFPPDDASATPERKRPAPLKRKKKKKR